MQEHWQQVWDELRQGLGRQPYCPEHPQYRCLATLSQGVVNDIIQVDDDGMAVRSHQTGQHRRIPASDLRNWWNHLLNDGTLDKSVTGHGAIVRAILVRGLPHRVAHEGGKKLRLLRMRISYNKRTSAFHAPCVEALEEERGLLQEGGRVQVDLGTGGGYDGDVCVHIRPGDTEHFGTDWEGADPTRFPARIKAAATALRDLEAWGTYRMRHEDGLLTIQLLTSQPESKEAEPVLRQTVPPQAKPKKLAMTRAHRPSDIDYVEHHAQNQELGLAGELLVVQYERQRLREAGRNDLAGKVCHVAVEEGDSAGYDVRSFNPDTGEPLYIEVKTTTGPAGARFFMSANELAFAQEYAERYRLYRLHGYNGETGTADFYVQAGDPSRHFTFVPKNYEVTPGEHSAS